MTDSFSVISRATTTTPTSIDAYPEHVELATLDMGIRVPRVANGVSGFAPYQVSLVDTTMNNHFCGGAILNAFIILTAAQCLFRDSRQGEDPTKVYYKDPNNVRIVAGQFNQQWPDTAAEQIRYVENGFKHSLFVYSTLEYDIAIIQLKTPLKITKFVRPIPLPISGRGFTGNVTIFGWGASKLYSDTKVQELPNTLQMTEMSIISNTECRRTQINPGDVNEYMGCAQSNKSTICPGDSGSPVVCKDHFDQPPPPFTTEQPYSALFQGELLCGIVSWSTGKSQCNVDDDGELISPPPPVVFTKVSSYTAWISKVLHNQVVVKGYFLCDDLQYIPRVQQCDGNNDCLDGSDEGNCSRSASSIGEGPKDITTTPTTSTTIQTTMKFYIQSTTENISTTDFYSTTRSCSESEFKCGNGRCIPRRFLCDMGQDCLDADNSDEKDCSNHTCPVGQFQCKSGHCISMHLRCDGEKDCVDMSDELACEPRYPGGKYCAKEKFECDNHLCVSNSDLCDGTDDCLDESDEKIPLCAKFFCDKLHSFQCANRNCIPRYQVCDGRDNCNDGFASDENNVTFCHKALSQGSNPVVEN